STLGGMGDRLRKDFGSMNMDELLWSIWTVEESQAMASVSRPGAGGAAARMGQRRERQPPGRRGGDGGPASLHRRRRRRHPPLPALAFLCL
ncbi:hypothetical protein EE612_015270, partial [Oryza sativa]